MEANYSSIMTRYCDWQDDSLSTFFESIIAALMTLCGLPAGILTILVLLRPRLLSVNSFYLILIAIVDCFTLVFFTLISVVSQIRSVSIQHIYLRLVVFVHPLVQFSKSVSTLLVICALIERLSSIGISKTGCCRRMCLRWLFPAFVLVVAFFWLVALYLLSLFSMTVKEQMDCPPDSFGRYYITLVSHTIGDRPHIISSYRGLLFSLVMLFFGIGAAVVLLVVHGLERDESARFHDCTKRTAALGLFCAVMAVPQLLLSVAETSGGFYDGSLVNVYMAAVSVASVAKMVCCASKFVIYFLLSPLFRRELFALFRRRHQLPMPPVSVSVPANDDQEPESHTLLESK